MTALQKYNAACKAVAAAKSIDEAKDIRDKAVAMAAYAKQAKNKDLEADAVEIRMRATRRLDELRQAQKKTVGLAKGGGDHRVMEKPGAKPTLASQGIDKNLAHQARTLGALSDEKFEQVIADTREAVTRAVRTVVRAADIEQSREDYEARADTGGAVESLQSLIEAGRKFSVIYADPPWEFKVYSDKGKQRSAERHYDTSSLDAIKQLPIDKLAADDCALFLWSIWPALPGALDVITAWGFTFKACAFTWVKQNPSGEGLFTGMGYWTRANSECCLLATRGTPTRIAMDVHQVITAPVGEHSRKPDEARLRIRRLLNGPYLELYGRQPVDGWTVWGNEVPLAYDAQDDITKSVEVAFEAIRERKAAGGPGWGEPYPELPAFLDRDSNRNNSNKIEGVAQS